MSGRERAVGQVVEAVLISRSQRVSGMYGSWSTAREIAEEAGLSKPTVRKYLKILTNSGLCTTYENGDPSRTILYYWKGGN